MEDALLLGIIGGLITISGTLIAFIFTRTINKLDCIEEKIIQIGKILYKQYLVQKEHHPETVKKYYDNPKDFDIFGITGDQLLRYK